MQLLDKYKSQTVKSSNIIFWFIPHLFLLRRSKLNSSKMGKVKLVSSCVADVSSCMCVSRLRAVEYQQVPPVHICHQHLSSENAHICSSNLVNIWRLASVNLLSTSSQTHPPRTSTGTTSQGVWLLFWGPSGWMCIYLIRLDHLAISAVEVQSWRMSCGLSSVVCTQFPLL